MTDGFLNDFLRQNHVPVIVTIGSEDLKVVGQAHDRVNFWSKVCVTFHRGSVKGDKNATLPSKIFFGKHQPKALRSYL